MLVARAFVLSFNPRAALAILLVALSVMYAVLTGSAANGLQTGGETLDPAFSDPRFVHVGADLAPFAVDPAWGNVTRLAHAEADGVVWGTVAPWPYGNLTVRGPYAEAPPAAALPPGFPLRERASPVAPWDWVLLPPDVFDARFPGVAGRATMVVTDDARDLPPLVRVTSPAAGAFYEAGAGQIYASVQLVVVAMGLTVAVLSAGVLQLEVLARERDLATLESLGGAPLVRRVVVLRALALSGAGVLLGLAGGALLTRVASKAIGGLAFRLDPLLVAEAALVSLAAGVAAGALGGLVRLRAPLAARLGRRGVAARPFPGPLRFLLVTPRVFTTTLVAAIVMTSVSGVVLAAADVPYLVFEPGEGTHVLGQSAGNPFRGTASRFFGEHATLLDNITAASPETMAPTFVKGAPVVVRGVHVDRWRSVDPVELREGRFPEAPGEALVGERAARTLDVGVNDTLVVPGAYRTTLHVLRVVGVHHAPGLLDDEIVTDLDTAGDLAALPPTNVGMIRLVATDEALAEALSGHMLRVTSLTPVPENPVPHTRAHARLELLNLADANATRTLNLRVNGVLVESVVAHLPPRGNATLDIPFLVPEAESLLLEVNPRANATTGEPALRVLAPERVALGSSFSARVVDAEGAPVPNATLEAGAQRVRTNATGAAKLQAPREGALTLIATEGERQGGRLVYVVDPARALGPHVTASVAVVTSTTAWNDTHVRYDLAVTLTNIGGAEFNGTVNATVDGATVGNATLVLPVEARATLALAALVPRGADDLTVAGLRVPLTAEGVELPPELRERTVEDVLREKREALARARDARDLEAKDFIDDIFTGLEPTVAVVVLATFLHAGAGVVVAVLREIREREEILHVLRDLGASEDQVASRALRDALASVLPGLLLGALLAWAAFRLLGPLGFPAAFGHTIPVALTPGFLARVVGGLALLAALTAFWATHAARHPPPRQARPVPLERLLEESP